MKKILFLTSTPTVPVNANPKLTALQWNERITDEEYARLSAGNRE